MINCKRYLIPIVLFFTFNVVVKSQINVPAGISYKYLKGSAATGLSPDWINPDFDDSSWNTGNAPIRYGDGTGGTLLSDMMNSYSTVFMRTTFEALNVENMQEISFTVNYDDGFVIWINGEEVLRQYAPVDLGHDAFATGLHESGIPELFIIDNDRLTILEGTNTLAVIGLNENLASTDFYFDVEISAQPGLPELIDTIGIAFNYPSGFYSSPFTLQLNSPDPSAGIKYTLDGSNPQNSTTSYIAGASASITINPLSTTGRGTTPGVVVRASLTKDGYLPSKPSGRTFIFLENVKTQSYPGYDWPNYNVNGQIIDLDMDPDVVNDSRYSDQIDDAMLDISTLSVITDNKNLFDPGYGIYVNAEQDGIEWERECTVELIHPNGSEGFSVNAGIRIRGGWSRHPEFPKHAFRLFFRSEYGNAKLEYPLFDDEGVSEFDKIDLRTAQNYAWSNRQSKNTMVREVFSRDSQRDMGQPYTRSRYYHLYINGLYWGLFQTQERSEARFASDYLGDSKEDYDVIKTERESWDSGLEVQATDGDLLKWENVWDILESGFEDNANYFSLEGKDASGKSVQGGEVLIDIDNLIDYMVGIFYTGDFDAPTTQFGRNKAPNNFFAINNRSDISKGFTFFRHDAEHSLFAEPADRGDGLYENRANLGTRTGDDRMEVSGFEYFHPQWLHFKLSDNTEYRQRFADRAAMHLSGNGVFTPENGIECFNKRAAEIETAIIAESARWGDSRKDWAYTKDDHWIPELNSVRNDFFPNRTDIVIEQLEEEGLYSSLKTPELFISGSAYYDMDYNLTAKRSIIIENLNTEGVIYYTLDGSDPRLVGGGISGKAIEDNEVNMEISTSTVIKSRIYNNGAWSAMRQVNFIAEQEDYSNFSITEIHYHPLDHIEGTDTTSGKSYEFLEFKNIGTSDAINLTGLVIDSAVYYEFPDNRLLAPQEFFVVAAKPTKFYERYGMIASGNFQNSLSNGGEQILITNASGVNVMNFIYDDHFPWPEEPDGAGPSMVSVDINPVGDPGDPYYWRTSFRVGGSPFEDDVLLSIEGEPIADITQGPWFKVYPNPTSGQVNIQVNGSYFEETLDVMLYSMSGSIVYSTQINGDYAFDLNSFNIDAGIYILSLRSSGGIETHKLIYNP